VLQKFRLAAQGKSIGKQPPDHLRDRIDTHFDPLPFYSETLEAQQTDLREYPLNAITQRPMAMYHSWDSQNAWLRQIHTYNYLYVNTRTAREAGIEDGKWMWVESMHGKVRCLCRHSEAVEPGTVWTWNAIGKATAAWGLGKNANESKKGFLLNHLISEELPPSKDGDHLSNSDPVTGQAGWYDVRVKIYPAEEGEPEETFPQYKAGAHVPGTKTKSRFLKGRWLRYFAGKKVTRSNKK
jgi:anaerobic selenocysteine-containing dehydrogenase